MSQHMIVKPSSGKLRKPLIDTMGFIWWREENPGSRAKDREAYVSSLENMFIQTPPRALISTYLPICLHRRFQEARAKCFLSFIMTIRLEILEVGEKEGHSSSAVGSLESSFKDQRHSGFNWCRKNDKHQEHWIEHQSKSKTKWCNACFSGYVACLLMKDCWR